MVLKKVVFFLMSVLLLQSCNEAEFYQKEFLKGAGVDIDKEIDNTRQSCLEAAQNNTLQTYSITVHFPAAIECEFNEGGSSAEDLNYLGNGPRKNGKIRARIEQYDQITVPNNGKICDLDFDFPEQTMEYDDEILLLMNDYVVMSSTNYSTESGSHHYDNGFKVNQYGLQEYKWMGDNGFYNLYYGIGVTPKYCLGVDPADPDYDQKCTIPQTQTVGQMKLDIPKDKIIELSTVSGLMEGSNYNQSTINFGFVTTGDNDNGDCEHSAYSFDVSIQYISAQ